MLIFISTILSNPEDAWDLAENLCDNFEDISDIQVSCLEGTCDIECIVTSDDTCRELKRLVNRFPEVTHFSAN